MNHKTPSGLGAGGRRMYRSIVADYELGDHEISILLQAARTVDLLESLQKILDDEGPIIESP